MFHLRVFALPFLAFCILTSPLSAQVVQEQLIVKIVKRLARTGETQETHGAVRWLDRVKPAIRDSWTIEYEAAFRQAQRELRMKVLQELKHQWFVRLREEQVYQILNDVETRASQELSQISTADLVCTFRSREDLLRFIDQNQWLGHELNPEELFNIRSLQIEGQLTSSTEHELSIFLHKLKSNPAHGTSIAPEIFGLQNGAPNAEQLVAVARSLTPRSQVNWNYATFMADLTLSYKWYHFWTRLRKLPRLTQTKMIRLGKAQSVLVKLSHAPKTNDEVVSQLTKLNGIVEKVAQGGEPGRFTLPGRYLERMIDHETQVVKAEIETMEALESVSDDLAKAVLRKIDNDSFYKAAQEVIGEGPSRSIMALRDGFIQLGHGDLELGIKRALAQTRGSYNLLSLRSQYMYRWLSRKVAFVIITVVGYYANKEPSYELPPFGEEEDEVQQPELGGEPPEEIAPTEMWKALTKLQIQETENSIDQLKMDKEKLREELKSIQDPVQENIILEDIHNKNELIQKYQRTLDDLNKKFNLPVKLNDEQDP